MGEYIKRLWMTAAAASTSSSLTSVSTYSLFTHLSYLLSHPTVFWANHSDLMIHLVCAIGVISGVMITLDIIPLISSFVCWLLYISIVNVGQSFFNHQWDLLICESGFLLMTMVQWHWEMEPMKRGPMDYHPPSPSLWLYRLLLFRVNFGRGMMGLMGKEKSWRILTSFLTYFTNQPSPTPMAWYGEKIPTVMLQGMGFWIMTVEIAFSILIAAPQLLRRSAAIYLLLLHLFFILTGNQSSYHWNLILLSFLLLDDQFYPRSLTSFLRRIRSRSAPLPSSLSSFPFFIIIIIIIIIIRKGKRRKRWKKRRGGGEVSEVGGDIDRGVRGDHDNRSPFRFIPRQPHLSSSIGRSLQAHLSLSRDQHLLPVPPLTQGKNFHRHPRQQRCSNLA